MFILSLLKTLLQETKVKHTDITVGVSRKDCFAATDAAGIPIR